jgi:hypothetical protein
MSSDPGDRRHADGYTGHAHVMRRRQLDALAAAGEDDARAALAAQLAATALHEGDLDRARTLSHTLDPMRLSHLAPLWLTPTAPARRPARAALRVPPPGGTRS